MIFFYFRELNNLSCKRSGIRSDHLSPRAPERFPNQVITPLVLKLLLNKLNNLWQVAL